MSMGLPSIEETIAHVVCALKAHRLEEKPYPQFFIGDMLPESVFSAINEIDLCPIDLDGVSGERALHNEGRHYFSPENRMQHEAMDLVAQAFQSAEVRNAVASTCNVQAQDCYLRIEYALDVNGFWLEPHTDIGAKKFSLLYYLTAQGDMSVLGTDIYDADKKPVGRAPFIANHAFAFVPSNITFHGFEPRTIEGVRKSLIINYVASDWRAREQLAFPDEMVDLS